MEITTGSLSMRAAVAAAVLVIATLTVLLLAVGQQVAGTSPIAGTVGQAVAFDPPGGGGGDCCGRGYP